MNTTVIPCACGCGETLTATDGRGRPRRFIHNHHAKLQPHQRMPIPCDQCGTPVMRAEWERRRDLAHTFCSQRCAGQWASEHGIRRGERNGHYRTITVPCAGCGAAVSKAPSLIKRRNHRVYCAACIPTATGRKGFYVGYPKAFNGSLRTQIRKRDEYTCQQCGRTQAEMGTLHVHHIDYTITNNDPMNLVALCRVCHGKTNWATAEWQARLSALMRERFADHPG